MNYNHVFSEKFLKLKTKTIILGGISLFVGLSESLPTKIALLGLEFQNNIILGWFLLGITSIVFLHFFSLSIIVVKKCFSSVILKKDIDSLRGVYLGHSIQEIDEEDARRESYKEDYGNNDNSHNIDIYDDAHSINDQKKIMHDEFDTELNIKKNKIELFFNLAIPIILNIIGISFLLFFLLNTFFNSSYQIKDKLNSNTENINKTIQTKNITNNYFITDSTKKEKISTKINEDSRYTINMLLKIFIDKGWVILLFTLLIISIVYIRKMITSQNNIYKNLYSEIAFAFLLSSSLTITLQLINIEKLFHIDGVDLFVMNKYEQVEYISGANDFNSTIYFDIGSIKISKDLETKETNKVNKDKLNDLDVFFNNKNKLQNKYFIKITGYASKEIIHKKNNVANNYQISLARANNMKAYILDIALKYNFKRNNIIIDTFAYGNQINGKNHDNRKVEIKIFEVLKVK